jgi:hypothetical protein
LLQIALQRFLLLAVGGFGEIGFQLFDFLGHVGDFVFHARDAALLDIFASGFGGDDFDSGRPGAGIGLVALVVIPVEMRVDDVADRLVGELLDLLDERAGGRGLGVGVDRRGRNRRGG